MKKVLSVLCIITLVTGIILPSYASGIIEANTTNNTTIDNIYNNVENNKDVNKTENNVVVKEQENVIEDNPINEIIENANETINSEEEKLLESESTQDNMVKSIEAGGLKLAEGIYTIRSVLPGNRAIGIDAGSKEDGANVNIWDYYGVGQQKFRLRIDSEGYYEIENIRSNKLLDVVQSIQGSGMNVDQWSNNGGTDNQKWIIEKGIEGYKIKSKLNGWYLNLENGVGANGENVNIEEGAEVRTQEFLIERIDEDGTETILNGTTNKIITKLSGRAVGVDGGRTENGADINLWDYERVDQQRFKFVYNEEGYYTIENIKSGKLLNVVGSGSESGTQIEQWEEQPSNEGQKWIVQDAGNGYYSIISKLNGLYLTVGGNGANCDLMYVENPTGGDNQKFQIIESGVPQGEKIVEEGLYKIVLANAPTQSLTVDGGKREDGANVHIWEYTNAAQQQFELVYNEDGYYEIIPTNSGKRLDVVGYGNESNVDQWSDNGGSDNQRWVIRKSKAGNYNIVSKRDSLYLDAYQSSSENGTNIQVYEQSGGNGQEFKLEKVENPKTVEEGTYKIVLATAPTQSITVEDGNTADGANVHIWEYTDSLQQQFNLVYDGQGYYEIIPLNSGKRLDVVGYGNEANVDQWTNNGGNDNQKWAIRKSEAGNYNIVSKRDSLYLDAYQSKTENGTNIQVYEQSGGNGQEFKLEKIENKSEKILEDGVYKIAPQANTNIVIEASASNTDNDGRVQIWQDFDVAAQRFKIEYINGYYRISFEHSGKCLTVKNRNISSGEEVVQYEWNEGDNQKWTIRDNGDGSVGIIPLSNYDLTLDIYGQIENGSGMELYYNERNIKQKFSIIKYFNKYIEEGTYGWSGLKVQGNGSGGTYLQYYKIGNGSKKLFVNFAIHGFEDSYDYDGAELTYMANQFFDYLKKNMTEELVNEWTVYILPTSNPDGQYNGWTNQGPGRTTLYSWAPGNKGIDMNRCFSVGYQSTGGNRNYNGTQPFQAFESESLRDFILNHTGTQNIVLDVHGWLNETIGDDGIGWYYRNAFGISKHIGTYGSGYFINWARSIPNTRSMLLELPQVWNHSQTVDWGYADKFNNATMQILKDF